MLSLWRSDFTLLGISISTSLRSRRDRFSITLRHVKGWNLFSAYAKRAFQLNGINSEGVHKKLRKHITISIDRWINSIGSWFRHFTFDLPHRHFSPTQPRSTLTAGMRLGRRRNSMLAVISFSWAPRMELLAVLWWMEVVGSLVSWTLFVFANGSIQKAVAEPTLALNFKRMAKTTHLDRLALNYAELDFCECEGNGKIRLE